MEEKIYVTNEIEITLKVIGGKWKPLVLRYLRDEGEKRYSEILKYLGSAPKKTLTAQLREMEASGLLTRTVYPEVPPRVEYTLTELGRSLKPILDAMQDWGEAYKARNGGG